MLDLSEARAFLVKRSSSLEGELSRERRIIKALEAGGNLAATDEAWFAERMADDGGIEAIISGHVPSSVVEAVLGVGRRTLQNYMAEGMPREGRNRYGLPAVVQWAVKNAGKRAHGKGDMEGRKLRAQARKLELEGDILAGKFVLRDGVVRGMERAIVEARGTLENLPALVGAIVPAGARVEVSDRVRSVVESSLKSLAEGKRLPQPVEVEDGIPANGGEDEEDADEPDGGDRGLQRSGEDPEGSRDNPSGKDVV